MKQTLGRSMFCVIVLVFLPLCFGKSPLPGSLSSSPAFTNSATDVTGWSSMILDDAGDFVVYWTNTDHSITFQVIVRTKGYFGLGLNAVPTMAGADMYLGWIDNGRTRFQDRHGVDQGEPVLDLQQDAEVLYASENQTHTVFRFRRKHITCDDKDFNITTSTAWFLYAYHAEDPVDDIPLPYHGLQRGAKRVYLLERVTPHPNAFPTSDVKVWDLRNVEVALPEGEDTLHWCKIFKLPAMDRKHHMIRFEPLLEPGHEAYLHHMNVYECEGDVEAFQMLADDHGTRCYQPSMPPLFFNCNNVVVAWTLGSEGFTFPAEAGYPLGRGGGARYLMLETHYDNPHLHANILDNSGIRIHYTSQLRHHDAGVLSIGLDPNWKHIVPPGQKKVVSEAHCVTDCTSQSLPNRGINVFAINMHTHLLGRQVRLRHIRGNTELSPIVTDSNYDVNYQEYRQLSKSVNILPGDHLISECVYNSESRSTITLGGLSTREETCLAYALYWPRVELSLCYSLPSLGTILTSLGIQELYPGSDPVRIKAPPELADQTVEERLITFDWESNFDSFQEATLSGAFRPLCWAKGRSLLESAVNLDHYAPNITRPYREASACLRPSFKVGFNRATTNRKSTVSPRRGQQSSKTIVGHGLAPELNPTAQLSDPVEELPEKSLDLLNSRPRDRSPPLNWGNGASLNRPRTDYEEEEIPQIILNHANEVNSNSFDSQSQSSSGALNAASLRHTHCLSRWLIIMTSALLPGLLLRQPRFFVDS